MSKSNLRFIPDTAFSVKESSVGYKTQITLWHPSRSLALKAVSGLKRRLLFDTLHVCSATGTRVSKSNLRFIPDYVLHLKAVSGLRRRLLFGTLHVCSATATWVSKSNLRFIPDYAFHSALHDLSAKFGCHCVGRLKRAFLRLGCQRVICVLYPTMLFKVLFTIWVQNLGAIVSGS